ncbi:MAG: TIGR00725 family protein [Candidatus Methanofastidiosia archaeon]
MQVSVIGSGGQVPEHFYKMARQLGKMLARDGHVVVCGGKGGIMEAVSKGVFEEGGIVVGILAENERGSGNRYLSAEVATGLGEMRNAIVVSSGDVIVAFPGAFGTLSELSFAMKNEKNIIFVCPHSFPVDFEALKYEKIYFVKDIGDIMSVIGGL